jgi:hypothetical protein
MIYIKFNIGKYNDDEITGYATFDELLQLDNYNEIVYIKCFNNKLYKLPKLPKSLIQLDCPSNNLIELPKLPNTLEEIYCSNNNLISLPELPKSLKLLSCWENNLTSLPELPNTLQEINCHSNKFVNLPELSELPNLKILACWNNNLTSLPYNLPNSLEFLNYDSNPIYDFINKWFDGDRTKYKKWEFNCKIKFANKIGEWFLECKYNPKYKYCRNRLDKEYDELFN